MEVSVLSWGYPPLASIFAMFYDHSAVGPATTPLPQSKYRRMADVFDPKRCQLARGFPHKYGGLNWFIAGKFESIPGLVNIQKASENCHRNS